MFTFLIFIFGLLFYWKPIYYALRASWLYYKAGEEDTHYLEYRAKFIDWSKQAWSLIRP